MGRVIMNGPPPGDWCPVCLMDAKQRQWETAQDEITAGYAASADKVTVIPWPAALDHELRRANYRAVCADMTALGLFDMCWDHVAGINPSVTPADVSQLDTQTKLPPGFMKRGKDGRRQ